MKIVFNEISIGSIPYVHDHMVDPIRDDNVECERYTGITPNTQWLAYTIPDGIIRTFVDSETWNIEIFTKHYEISFSVPRTEIHNVSIF